MPIAPNATAPAPATPNAPAKPNAPPATTPIAFKTAISTGTKLAIIGTNSVMLEIKTPFTIFPNTVPIVRILVANLSQDFVDASIPALNALKKPSALSPSTECELC